jgi:hypothetical protein
MMCVVLLLLVAWFLVVDVVLDVVGGVVGVCCC